MRNKAWVESGLRVTAPWGIQSSNLSICSRSLGIVRGLPGGSWPGKACNSSRSWGADHVLQLLGLVLSPASALMVRCK